MTDQAHALEVRRLKFLTKVFLTCRLSTNRSIALKSLTKNCSCKQRSPSCQNHCDWMTVLDSGQQTRQRIDSFPRSIVIG